ncbi:hypothetical protein D3C79_499270 [compost metagenome]
MVRRGVEDLLVQAAFSVSLTQFTQQHLACLGDQPEIGLDRPVRVLGQMLAVECPQCRFGSAQGLGQESSIGFFWARQHQIGFEVDVSLLCPLRARRRQVDQRLEPFFQLSDGWVTEQLVIGLRIEGPHRFTQLVRPAQAKALIPRCAVF